jgi:hypothetical protein
LFGKVWNNKYFTMGLHFAFEDMKHKLWVKAH